MITAIRTKERYKYLLILLHCSLVALSQNSKPSLFRDFPIVQNLDSFERVVHKKKNNLEQYLNGLITLEKNREDYIGWFGQDLETIKTLADKLRSPLAKACYHYFEGLNSRKRSINSACRNILEALEYFEPTKDTLGMVKSYYYLMFINAYSEKYKIKKIQDRRFYFDKIMELSQTSKDIQVKFVRVYSIAFFEKIAKSGKQNYSERIGEIEETLRILDKNPSIQPSYAQLYTGISSFYQRYNFSQLAFEYQLKSHELFKTLTSNICIKSYLNMGTTYHIRGSYMEAEPFLWKGIHAMEKLKDEERDNTTLLNLYVVLSKIQFIKKEYAASQNSSNQAIEIQHIITNNLKVSLYEELQTQNEINQKEMENALLLKKNEMAEMNNQQLQREAEMSALIQKNQLVESQNLQYQKDAENRTLLQKNKSIEAYNKQYMLALYIAAVSLVLFSVLLYFLYKLNAKQKQLILFRDQLFAIIAHDMRTPITAFKGFSEGVAYLMKKGEYQNIHILSQSIDQLIFNTNLLLDNLLNWYYLQSNTTKTDKSTFSVYELVKESADLYEAIAKNRQIRMEVEIPNSLTLYANRNAFLLIMRNLIDNAIKYGKSKKIMIKASLEANQIVIEVVNSKTIIPNTKLITLQEQMKQNSVVIKEGRGLGLYLVSHFVGQHKGSVSIESQEEFGTRFRVAIPTIG